MWSMQEYTTSILFSCVGVLAFATFVVFGIFINRFISTYGFHLNEFKKYDTLARRLSSETTQMRKDVELDYSADCLTKTRNKQLLAQADILDNGIRIALAAWEDITDPEDDSPTGKFGSWKLDIESKGDKMIKGRRRSHGRWVIGLMRKKCKEGLEKRMGMVKELGAVYNEVMKIDLQSNLFNRRIASGHEPLSPSSRTVSHREQTPARVSYHVLPKHDFKQGIDGVPKGIDLSTGLWTPPTTPEKKHERERSIDATGRDEKGMYTSVRNGEREWAVGVLDLSSSK
ncbi:hypothetical protein BDZ45DRAFT_805662 [Acephala macrosclerotiorum]|nr:hypothetical protein BDZ45DRAFT_805662 [Acephala macrosclerotiorum]